MLPSLTATLVHASVACGACVDMPILSGLPFLGWWMLLFIGWSLLVGPLVFRFTNTGNATDLKHPAKLFLALFVVLIVSVFITGGSLMLPFILVAPFWISALVSGIRCSSHGWRKFCITVVGVMVLVIPVSYAFPMITAPAPHAARPRLPAMTPTVPATSTTPAVPATPTATTAPSAPTTTPPAPPTVQDALPAGQGKTP
jgi:hypothetical protein